MPEPLDQSTTATAPARGAPPTMATAYRVVLGVFLLLGVVQIFLAGLGAFSFLGSGPGFEPHRTVGFIMSGVALLVLVFAVLAQAGARAIGVAAVLFLLATLGQSLLAVLGQDSAWWGGLHALDGLLMLGLAGFLQSTARRGPVVR